VGVAEALKCTCAHKLSSWPSAAAIKRVKLHLAVDGAESDNRPPLDSA